MSKCAYFIGLMLSLIGGAAYPQSVLERVLEQVENSTNISSVSGVYANISEAIVLPPVISNETELVTIENAYSTGFSDLSPDDILFVVDVYQTDGTYLDTDIILVSDIDTEVLLSTGDRLSVLSGETWASQSESYSGGNENIRLAMYYGDAEFNTFNFVYPNGSIAFQMDEDGDPYDGVDSVVMLDISNFSIFQDVENGARYFLPSLGAVGLEEIYNYSYSTEEVNVVNIFYPDPVYIDGSISNSILGASSAVSNAIVGVTEATNIKIPEINLGDMATTALGAVNTGDITLGVNSSIDEVSTITTRAISAAMEQVGGSSDVGALVLNVASNASSVNGFIQNSLTMVSASLGNISTTALGSVNTGAIASGVNASVMSIVGFSGS